jgi:arylsulfatase A-like enzyme
MHSSIFKKKLNSFLKVGNVMKKISLSLIVVLAMVGLICLSGSMSAADSKKPPNVLLIMSDNQPKALLGAYGNKDIKSPNIDRLALDGIRFENVFAVNGMCSPTRATLLTGLMPSQHGLHNWLDDKMLGEWPADWVAIQEFRTLPLTLKNRGFQTALIGKWHLGQPRQPAKGFDYWLTFPYGHTLSFYDNIIIDNGKEYPLKDKHIVDFFTEKAVEYIQNYDGKKPFYLQLVYDGPYMNPPTNVGPDPKNKFYKDYEHHKFSESTFPRERINENILQQLYTLDLKKDFMGRIFMAVLRMNGDQATYANIAAQNAIVDDGVGKVLAALKSKGIEEDTVVIYMTDQGNLIGQHGIWTHITATTPSSPYNYPLNIPFIVRHKGSIPAGGINHMMIGQYDIALTILDYLDFSEGKFDRSPGRSFAKALKGGTIENWGDEVFIEQEETRAIITSRYAYWKRLKGTGVPELYDLEKDPDQNKNVYGQENYNEVAQNLDRKLTQYFEKYSDPRYDLWKGGRVKGSTMRPEIFKKLYGNDWAPVSEVKQPFIE